MNRRAFLTGLLSSTAVVAVPVLASPTVVMMPTVIPPEWVWVSSMNIRWMADPGFVRWSNVGDRTDWSPVS